MLPSPIKFYPIDCKTPVMLTNYTLYPGIQDIDGQTVLVWYIRDESDSYYPVKTFICRRDSIQS